MIFVKLKNITIENFKGIKYANLKFSESENVLSGQNGCGKTTIRNAWEWVLCQNIAGFVPSIDGKEITETVTVSCSLDINGKVYTFKREKPYGKDYSYYIDDIPTKFRQYREFIADIFSEKLDYATIMVLTDKNRFNEMAQTEKEQILFAMADKDGVAERLKMKREYADIFDFLDKGYSVGEMQKLIKTQRTKTKNEQDVINGKISYIENEIKELNKYNFEKIEEELKLLNLELDSLICKSQEDLQSEETAKISQEIEQISKQQLTLAMERMIKLAKAKETDQKLFNECIGLKYNYDSAADDYKKLAHKIEKFDPDISPICAECGNRLSDEKIEELRQSAQERLQKMIDDLEELAKSKSELKNKYNTTRQKRYDILQQIDTFSNPSNEENELEAAKNAQKCALEKAKQGLVDKTLSDKISAVRENISKLNQTLSMKTVLLNYKAKIVEYRTQNVELADQLLVLVKKELVLKDYIQEFTEQITDNLNSCFDEKVKWQLFTEKEVDGEIVRTSSCSCTLNGVAYETLSNGEKNIANIETVKGIQNHYGIKLPLWSDDDESITIDYEYDGQIFKLRAIGGKEIENVELFKKEN